MTTAEQPCYTLINLPSDSDPPTEQKLAEDLGEYPWICVQVYSILPIKFVVILPIKLPSLCTVYKKRKKILK